MKINKYNQTVKLTLWPRLFPINCYLYEEENELTLIDTGMVASFKGISSTIVEMQKPLTNIILTHAHGDHVGSLDKLKETFPDVCVSISKRDSRLLRGDKTLDENEPRLPIKGDIPKSIKTIPDRLLEEGDRVGSLQVLDTPGHTPGSIALLDTQTNAIFAGDAFQTQGKVAVCGQIVPLFPFPAFGTWNKEMSLESARKILKLKPSLLAVGHGKVIVNPEVSIRSAIEAAERNISVLQQRKEA